MITLIKQTLDIINEMALTGDKEKDAQRIFNYIQSILNWDVSKMTEDVSWIVEYLNKHDLKQIALKVPDEDWKEKVWVHLFKQNPSNDDLVWIILHASDEWKERAWRQLLRQNPSNKDLKWIMSLGSEPYKSMAKEMLDNLKQE